MHYECVLFTIIMHLSFWRLKFKYTSTATLMLSSCKLRRKFERSDDLKSVIKNKERNAGTYKRTAQYRVKSDWRNKKRSQCYANYLQPYIYSNFQNWVKIGSANSEIIGGIWHLRRIVPKFTRSHFSLYSNLRGYLGLMESRQISIRCRDHHRC